MITLETWYTKMSYCPFLERCTWIWGSTFRMSYVIHNVDMNTYLLTYWIILSLLSSSTKHLSLSHQEIVDISRKIKLVIILSASKYFKLQMYRLNIIKGILINDVFFINRTLLNDMFEGMQAFNEWLHMFRLRQIDFNCWDHDMVKVTLWTQLDI